MQELLFYFFIILAASILQTSTGFGFSVMATPFLLLLFTPLGGQLGRVIVPIPVDGFGEVVIETTSGMISKRATGYDNEAIDYDETVLVVDVKDGTLFVRTYEKKFV